MAQPLAGRELTKLPSSLLLVFRAEGVAWGPLHGPWAGSSTPSGTTSGWGRLRAMLWSPSLKWVSWRWVFFADVVDTRRQHIKKQRHYFVNKGPSRQGYGFSSGHVRMSELDWEESWAPKNWCFWTVVLEKTLESPLDCKEIQPVHPKGDQSWVFNGRTDVEAETPMLWPPDAKSWLIGKDPGAGKDWRQEEKGTTEDKMVGWHHLLNGRRFGWTPGTGDGQGGLACCDSWGPKEPDTTERLNWTELAEFEASLVAQSVKNLPAMQEGQGSIPGSRRSPGEGNGNPLQYSCLEKFHGQGSLVRVYKILSIWPSLLLNVFFLI